MSENHIHEHVVQVTATGKSLEDAISNGVAALTDPRGHHATLSFESFEVLKINGTISHKPDSHGGTGHIKVMLQALGCHSG